MRGLIQKPRKLPTDKLVLISESGLPRRSERSDSEKAIPLTPKDLDADDPAVGVLLGLRSLWPKELKLIPETATLVERRPDGRVIRLEDVKANLGVFFADGQRAGTLADFLKLVYDWNFTTFAETVGLADITEDTERGFVFQYVGPVGDDRYLYLRMEEATLTSFSKSQEE